MVLSEIRRQWRDSPKTDRVRETCPDQTGNERGQCQGEFCRSDGFPYEAYLKPGKINKEFPEWPYPAYEKIAADFAYDLECPVPVTQIWERNEGETNGYARYSSLSLKEFPRKYNWSACQQALADAGTTNNVVAQIITSSLARTSGILVLDTWLGQRDRGDHPNNVALSYDPDNPARAQFTYFDFAQTLNYDNAWKDDKWMNVTLTAQPALVMKNLDKRIVKATYENVMDKGEDSIRNIALRLAGGCLPGEEASSSQSTPRAAHVMWKCKMTKPIKKLPIEYLVIKCAVANELTGLGILGRIILPGQEGLIFYVGSPPKSIKGVDPFEMKIISAAPEAIRNDVRHFLSEKIPPDKLLGEISRRYRGTVFASDQMTETVSVEIPPTSPEKLLSCFSSAIMQIAVKEKVQPMQKKPRRQRTKSSAPVRSAAFPRYKFPRLEFMDTRALV